MQLARGEHQSQVWGLRQDQVPEPVLRNARTGGPVRVRVQGHYLLRDKSACDREPSQMVGPKGQDPLLGADTAEVRYVMR